MSIAPPSQFKNDRFAMFNKQKVHQDYIPYPKMLQNDDGTTTIVHDENEHRAVAGKRFSPDSYVGGKTGDQQPAPVQMAPQPIVNIPDTAMQRSGVKMKALDGQQKQNVVPQPNAEIMHESFKPSDITINP